ncbi:MAG TPA: MmcQ/YjbR family DNA-binding protein [Pseudonocardiaceae bacterium]|nr:MmcQ/YjbR family DNA-binding protein [Pseudonocardiaceae bacterium]
MDDDPLERLRRICLALPETTERLSHGEPTFFVRGKKVFVTYADQHHDDRLAFWCHAPAGAQQAVVQSDPRRYFVPPYVGGRGWIGVYLDVEGADNDDTFWAEVAELVEDAYRMVAPRALLAQLDAQR